MSDGIAQEEWLTAELKEVADWVVDTSDLAPRALRQLIEQQFGPGTGAWAAGPECLPCFFRIPARLASGSRSGIRRPVFAEPPLRSHIEAKDGAGRRGRFVRRGRPGLRGVLWLNHESALLGLAEIRSGREEILDYSRWLHRGKAPMVYLVEKIGAYLRGGSWRLEIVHRELAREDPTLSEGD